ncbi:DmsE family decaheme c-type cytochrome [Shewanella livingstonensis]|uniref:DmsE family decaheme c-type cytochrome n=1 Tax=Shewanella livingstonensis TaxID=150120 RepID=A0A3G8LV62_9GAMM|nr:DmsE family decaheme c-type cytochrome [Shewanella livingstonensis]AZG73284.1 DmsE family decaheme c-type cytochrome [Shewanella livingstonensis]
MNMTIKKTRLFYGAILTFALVFTSYVGAAQSETANSKDDLKTQQLELLQQKFTEGKYSKSGADTCMACHKKTAGVADIFSSVHGNPNTVNGPMAGLQCESCHGPKGKHIGKNEPMISFGKKSPLTAEMQNSVCLACHNDSARLDWHSSVHVTEDVACVDCHQLHTPKDKVLTKQGENEKCMSCHTKEKADSHKRSAHDIKNNDMSCSDCHNPHGTMAEASMNQDTINDTCYQCHAEKRGPFLWEHAPVIENCANCHDAHGAVNERMLKTRVPMLCKQCHGNDYHPSGIPSGNTSIQTAGQGCLNCHTQIHGSNNPAGRTFQY